MCSLNNLLLFLPFSGFFCNLSSTTIAPLHHPRLSPKNYCVLSKLVKIFQGNSLSTTTVFYNKKDQNFKCQVRKWKMSLVFFFLLSIRRILIVTAPLLQLLSNNVKHVKIVVYTIQIYNLLFNITFKKKFRKTQQGAGKCCFILYKRIFVKMVFVSWRMLVQLIVRTPTFKLCINSSFTTNLKIQLCLSRAF